MTGAEPNALLLELDFHFSFRDEIHGMGELAASGDHVTGFDLLRVQQPHDVGDFGCLEFREQGHAGDHSPGDDEVATMDFLGERGCDNADGQRDHDQADEDRDRGDDASQRGHRNDVAIADRAQRDDCPPHRVGNGAEFVGLRAAFDHMHDAGDDERRPYQNHETTEQRAALRVKRIQERTSSPFRGLWSAVVGMVRYDSGAPAPFPAAQFARLPGWKAPET